MVENFLVITDPSRKEISESCVFFIIIEKFKVKFMLITYK
jgi:hypothetical protein